MPHSGLLSDGGANTSHEVLGGSAPAVQSGWNALSCLHSVFRTPPKVTCWSGLGQGQSSEVLVLQSQAQNPVPQVKKPVSGLRAQDPERTGLQCLPFAIHSTLAWRRGPQGMPPCAVTHLALGALVLPLLVFRTLLHPSVTPPPPPPGTSSLPPGF